MFTDVCSLLGALGGVGRESCPKGGGAVLCWTWRAGGYLRMGAFIIARAAGSMIVWAGLFCGQFTALVNWLRTWGNGSGDWIGGRGSGMGLG